MEWRSNIQQKINELLGEVRRLESTLESERDRFIAEKVAAGWKLFEFHSEYYGSHEEGNIDDTYLFSPAVNASKWEGARFEHGSHSESELNTEFSKWLEGLGEEDYYNF